MAAMNIEELLYRSFYPGFAFSAMRAISASLKLKVLDLASISELKTSGKRLIYILWHGRQFLVIHMLSQQKIGAMVSTSRDGILQANIIKKYGYKVIPGSSEKAPIRALAGALRYLKENHNFIMAVDGPRGPIYQPKPGAVYLAKKTQAVLVPVTFSVQYGFRLSAWDKYLFPLPFSRAVFIYGKPVSLSSSLDQEVIERDNLRIKGKLDDLRQMADSICGPQRIIDFSS
jgi:hypothetical protein